MRPEFDIAFDFFQRTLIKKGFSKNIHWLFRENILVKKGGKGRYKFTLNPDLNKPNEKVKTIYNKLKDENSEIFFYTFIKGEKCTYATIAGDDYDFEIDEGDVKKEEWSLKFGFSGYFDLAPRSTLKRSWIRFTRLFLKDRTLCITKVIYLI